MFKVFSYLELWWPFVQCSQTLCAILKECILRNIFFEIIFLFRPVVKEEMSFKDNCAILDSIIRNISVKLF